MWSFHLLYEVIPDWYTQGVWRCRWKCCVLLSMLHTLSIGTPYSLRSHDTKTHSGWSILSVMAFYISINGNMIFFFLSDTSRMVGSYSPQCLQSGLRRKQYDPVQCMNDYCWCVSQDGVPINETLTRGGINCNQQGKWQFWDLSSSSIYFILASTKVSTN